MRIRDECGVQCWVGDRVSCVLVVVGTSCMRCKDPGGCSSLERGGMVLPQSEEAKTPEETRRPLEQPG